LAELRYSAPPDSLAGFQGASKGRDGKERGEFTTVCPPKPWREIDAYG